MSKTKRIEELVEQAKQAVEGMGKTHRIEILEQRVAELMGEVERLKAAEQARQGWLGAVPPYDMRPTVTFTEPPHVPTAVAPHTTWPYETTSGQEAPFSKEKKMDWDI